MSLKKIPENAISKYPVRLYPHREFQSGSAGTVGSVYVFPNRSNTQKDNIDERLEFAPIVDGVQIKPFDVNSLEQRRIDIYGGDFSNILVGPFRDFVPTVKFYRYSGISTISRNTYTSDPASDINDELWSYGDTINADLVTVDSDGNDVPADTNFATFEYRDINGGFWISNGKTYIAVPDSTAEQRDVTNYEPALALLLDGAHPLAQDHAWRGGIDPDEIQSFPYTAPDGTVYDVLNDSAVQGATLGVFSGFTIDEDENGLEFLDRPIVSKDDVNPWPPEIEKWGYAVNPQFVTLGYSDLSMHPRNMTKKDISIVRSSHDAFGRGTIAQKQLFQKFRNSLATDSGWWCHNKYALTLNSYEDPSDGTMLPALHYDNDSNVYGLENTDGFTIDCWIKPSPTQIDIGTIVHLEGNYALTLEPHADSVVDGVPQYYRVSWHWNTNAGDSAAAGTPDVSSNYLLRQGQWHRVTIRWSQDFNNGKFDIWIDDVMDVEDKNYSPANISSGNTVLTIGCWNEDSTNDTRTLLDGYAETQSQIWHNGTALNSYGDGKTISTSLQLNSMLGSLNCYNTALTQLELREENESQSMDPERYLWRFTWQYDTSDNVKTWHKLYFKGDGSKGNLDSFYKEGLVEVLDEEISRNTPYSVNAGHITGMPLVHVHGFCEEKVQGQYPVITGYPAIADITDTDAYPEYDGMTPASDRINYFIDHWKKWHWLRSMNTLLSHSDEPYQRRGIIEYSGANIGNLDEDKSLAHFYDDEKYTLSDETLAAAGSGLTQDSYATSAIKGSLSDSDFLPPFSTIINIPVIYYGMRIKERSLVLEWSDESTGKSYQLIDKAGILYHGMLGMNNKVGHIDYENGLVCIFSPLLSTACLDNFSIAFDGEKDLNVMQFDLQMGKRSGTVSSNKSYKPLRPSSEANDNEAGVIGVSDVYIHDENLNILAKARLANPILKRANDSFLFRLRLDF